MSVYERRFLEGLEYASEGFIFPDQYHALRRLYFDYPAGTGGCEARIRCLEDDLRIDQQTIRLYRTGQMIGFGLGPCLFSFVKPANLNLMALAIAGRLVATGAGLVGFGYSAQRLYDENDELSRKLAVINAAKSYANISSYSDLKNHK